MQVKNKKLWLLIVGILILGDIGLIVYKVTRKDDIPKNETKIIDTVNGYNLEDRDLELYKTEFNTLKTNLTSNEINYEEYAKSIAKLYIIDLYTLNNKVNKYDVGGIEFVNETAKENYILKVEDTIYKYLKDNTKGDRQDIYPIVSAINVNNVVQKTYTFNNTRYDAYDIELSWTYETENEYDTSAWVTVVNDNNKLSIVEENRVSN